MNIGNRIMKLRKKNNLSQEDLAEEIGVTRQTISKWELGETSPDINQAKKLSIIFKVSLDELTDNNVNNILIEKVSNTEKLAGIAIKILKIIGIAFVIILLLNIILFGIILAHRIKNNDREISGIYSLICKLNDEEYLFELRYNKNYQIIEEGGDAWIANHTDVDKYDDANKAIAHIEDWFNDHNGSCIVEQTMKNN